MWQLSYKIFENVTILEYFVTELSHGRRGSGWWILLRFLLLQIKSNQIKSLFSVTKPNAENCKNCSSKCAYDCAQLQYTIQYRTVLIISRSNLQTTTIAEMLSVGGGEGHEHLISEKLARKPAETRRHCENSEGRSVAPRWPRPTAILQRSAGGVLSLSLRIWSIHLQRGRPGGRFHSRLGSRPSVRSMWCRSALYAGSGTSSSSLAIWPKTATRYGAWDWRKVGDCGDLVVPNKLVPFDLKKLPPALQKLNLLILLNAQLLHTRHLTWTVDSAIIKMARPTFAVSRNRRPPSAVTDSPHRRQVWSDKAFNARVIDNGVHYSQLTVRYGML